MHCVDMESWPRREHFEFFSSIVFPCFGLASHVDPTPFSPVVKQRGVSFTRFMRAVPQDLADEMPSFAGGKMLQEGELLKKPQNVHYITERWVDCTLGDTTPRCKSTYTIRRQR